MKRILLSVLLLLTYIVNFSQEIDDIFVAEYKDVFKRKSDSTLWMPFYVGGQGLKAVQMTPSNLRFIKGDGGLYENLVETKDGDLYIQINSTTTLQPSLVDASDVAFKAATNVDKPIECYFRTHYAIRNTDGKIYEKGYNSYNDFPGGTNLVVAKWTLIPNQPAVTFKYITKGGETGSGHLVAIASDGTVYTKADNTTTWVVKTLPGPATKVYGSLNGFYIAIIAGQPYGWGQSKYLTGTAGTISTNEPLADNWGLGTDTLIDLAVNDNTIHYIRQGNTLWGLGDNTMGEVGNGYELVNKKEVYQGSWYIWNWIKPTQASYQNIAEQFVETPIQLSVGKFFTRVWSGNYYAYYHFAKELTTNDIYGWGRNKSGVLMNGKGADNEASLPNTMDVLVPTKVTPLTTITQSGGNYVFGTVNAGSDRAIVTNNTTLTGSATPGHTNTWTYSIASYNWAKIAGPACTIVTPNASSTSVTGMGVGTYTFKLTATDNNTATITDTVIITVSPTPLRIVGNAQYVSGGVANLTSTATSSDGIRFIKWTVLTRPSQPTYKIFVGGSSTFNATGATTVDSGCIRRIKRFWKTYNLVDTLYERAIGGRDTRHGLPVNASSVNTATVTNYDSTRSVTAATRRAVHLYMNGYPSNNYGDPTTIANHITWWKETRDSAVAGGVEFWLGTTQPRTDGSAPQARFRSAADSVRANFPNNYIEHYRPLAVPNNTTIRPELAFGDNIHINNRGHEVLATNWIATNPLQNLTKGSAVFTNPNTENTTVLGLTQGLWRFIVAVQDTNGYMAYQVVELNVPAPPPVPPTADAGDDQIVLGNSTTLFGSGTPDGSATITAYQWAKISGPLDDDIEQESSAQTDVTFVNPGTYIYRLIVTDSNGLQGQDDVQVDVTVNGSGSFIIIKKRMRVVVKPTVIVP